MAYDSKRAARFVEAIKQVGSLTEAYEIAAVTEAEHREWEKASEPYMEAVEAALNYYREVTLKSRDNILYAALGALKKVLAGKNTRTRRVVRQEIEIDEDGTEKVISMTREVVTEEEPIDLKLIHAMVPAIMEMFKVDKDEDGKLDGKGSGINSVDEQTALLLLTVSDRLKGELDINTALVPKAAESE